jgi:hypothetical protein
MLSQLYLTTSGVHATSTTASTTVVTISIGMASVFYVSITLRVSYAC